MPDQQHLDRAANLDLASADLDRLIQEHSFGMRSVAHYDALEACAQDIAQRIVATFRERTTVPIATITPARSGRGVWVS